MAHAILLCITHRIVFFFSSLIAQKKSADPLSRRFETFHEKYERFLARRQNGADYWNMYNAKAPLQTKYCELPQLQLLIFFWY